jgi:hypothetical protein
MAEPVKEAKEVVGILPRGIDADDKLHGSLPLSDVFEALA